MYDVSLANTRAFIASTIAALELNAVIEGTDERFCIAEPAGQLSAARMSAPDFRVEVAVVKAGADVLVRGGSHEQRRRMAAAFNEIAPHGHVVRLGRGAVKAEPFVTGASYAYANFGLRQSGLVYGETESFARSADRALLAISLYGHFSKFFVAKLIDSAIAGDPILDY